VSSTGAAVEAVRRTPVSALSRTSVPVMPVTGRSSTRTSAGITAGASTVAATISAMAHISADWAMSETLAAVVV
jgi:hypothetical protein